MCVFLIETLKMDSKIILSLKLWLHLETFSFSYTVCEVSSCGRRPLGALYRQFTGAYCFKAEVIFGLCTVETKATDRVQSSVRKETLHSWI